MVWPSDGKGGLSGRDPFNQNSDRSDREKWSTSKFFGTSVFETFPVGPNGSIEFWTEIYGNFGWMNRALDLSIFIFNFPILNFPSTPPLKIKKLRNQKFHGGAKVFLFSSFRFLSKYFGFGTNTQSWTPRQLNWKLFSLFIWLGIYFSHKLSFSSFLSFVYFFFSTKSWQFLSIRYRLRYPNSTNKANPIFWCPSRDHPIKVTAHVHCVMLPWVEFCAMRPETFSSFSASKLVLSIHKCKIPWFKST